MIANIVNIDKGTVRQIDHDKLNMRKVCAQIVHNELTQDKKTTVL